MRARHMPWTVAPLDRSIAHRLEGMMPRPIARLRTDGGTTFCIRSDASDWHPEFRKTFEWLVNMPAEERRRRKTNPIVGLPLPSVPGRAPGLAFAGSTDEDEPDPRVLGWGQEARDNPYGPRVPVEAWVTGGDTPCLHFHAADRAFITMYQRKDAEGIVKWECRVQCKARELYADGLNLWMVRWLGALGWLLAGRYCLPSDSHALGWRTTQWHINSDFVGLHFRTEDAWKVCGWLSGSCYGDTAKAESRREEAHLEQFKKANPYFASTVYLGRLTSDTCMVVYQKSEQLRDEKQVDPTKSMYAPEWKANGWDGELDVTRVELRLRKKALIYVDPVSHDVLYDFRDPNMLLAAEARRHVWQYVTSKRRLVCPEHAKSRLTRSPVDPAWLRVIRLGYDAPDKDIRQIPRSVRALTREERMGKAQYNAMLQAFAFASQHGAALKSWQDVGATLIAMGERMLEGEPAEVRSALPRVVDLGEVGDYAVQTSVFFRDEADWAFDDFCEEVGRDLARVDWGKALGRYGARLRRFLARARTQAARPKVLPRDFWEELDLAVGFRNGRERPELEDDKLDDEVREAVRDAIRDHLALGPIPALEEVAALKDAELAAELEGLFYDALVAHDSPGADLPEDYDQ